MDDNQSAAEQFPSLEEWIVTSKETGFHYHNYEMQNTYRCWPSPGRLTIQTRSRTVALELGMSTKKCLYWKTPFSSW